MSGTNDIVAMVDLLKEAMVLSTVGTVYLGSHPQRAQLLKTIDLDGRTQITWGRTTGPTYALETQHYLESEPTPERNRLFVRAWPERIVIEVGDALAKESYIDRAPTLEFLRHVRNGLAHGGRFKVLKIPRPAQFGSLRISTELHDTWVRDLLWPGDLLALVDEVCDHLRKLEA